MKELMTEWPPDQWGSQGGLMIGHLLGSGHCQDHHLSLTVHGRVFFSQMLTSMSSPCHFSIYPCESGTQNFTFLLSTEPSHCLGNDICKVFVKSWLTMLPAFSLGYFFKLKWSLKRLNSFSTHLPKKSGGPEQQ